MAINTFLQMIDYQCKGILINFTTRHVSLNTVDMSIEYIYKTGGIYIWREYKNVLNVHYFPS